MLAVLQGDILKTGSAFYTLPSDHITAFITAAFVLGIHKKKPTKKDDILTAFDVRNDDNLCAEEEGIEGWGK